MALLLLLLLALLALGRLMGSSVWPGAVFPVSVPRVTLPFGSTRPPYRPGHPHRGVDLSPHPAAFGELIVSPWAGEVVLVDESEAFGRFVLVRYEFPFPLGASSLSDGVITIEPGTPVWVFFAHMSMQTVRVGQAVNPGGVLGEIGDTGAAVGAHVHMEARLGSAQGDVVNPLDMLIATVVGLRERVVFA